MAGSELENGGKTPIFEIEQVQLMFTLNNIVSMVVASNVLCMALRTGRIIRIDLDNPEAVDDIDLPKKPSETGKIKAIFLDPTGTHLLITTTLGDNYCLNSSSTKPKALARLKGLLISSVAWCPHSPSRVTGDILIGASDGTIHETLIEPSNEYFKREDRYVRQVWKSPSGEAITGLYAFHGTEINSRRVIALTKGKIYFWQGKVAKRGEREIMPVYPKYFEQEAVIESFDCNDYEMIAVSPARAKDYSKHFAWLNGVGILHGSLVLEDSSKFKMFTEADLLLYDQLNLDHDQPVKSLLLTDYHILLLQGDTVLGINRLNSKVVFRERVKTENNDPLLGLCEDTRESTFWVYSEENLFEIKIVGDEEKDIWQTLLETGEYEEAMKLAKDAYAKDVVYTTYGDHLMERKEYTAAAPLLGKSSKPFEGCTLRFMETGDYEALYIYLTARLRSMSKAHKMQRTIVATWVIELIMERLNILDDRLAAAHSNDEKTILKGQLEELNKLYVKFIGDYKHDLDKATVYEIISMHSRQEELLHYASVVEDGSFVLSYWIRVEQWEKALQVLVSENSPELTYKYATVLLVNAPRATVDAWMRISDLDPAKLIPAFLSYVSSYRGSSDNQAIRYLKYAVGTLQVDDTAVHNALVAIYASSNYDEEPLLNFLQDQVRPKFDYDFALRICMQFNRTQCSVYIYSVMGLYQEAVKLALHKNNIDLAASVADRPANDPALRKTLWLEVARKVVTNEGFDKAVGLMDKCELLKIEDLLPLVPEFTVLDNQLKDQVIASMENYNDQIGQLNREMEDSVNTAANVKQQINKFRKRYALVEPGEACALCEFPLATRRFYVFPCQHAFHFDCLLTFIKKSADPRTKQKITEHSISGVQKDLPIAVDEILSESCVLCSENKIESIDVPLVTRQMGSFAL